MFVLQFPLAPVPSHSDKGQPIRGWNAPLRLEVKSLADYDLTFIRRVQKVKRQIVVNLVGTNRAVK